MAFDQLLLEPVRNGIYKPKEFHGRGAKIVNMGELFANPRLGSVPMKRIELTKSESDRFTLAIGDLLFARRSLVAEGAGKCSIVLDMDEPTTFESSIIRARPDRRMADSLFLYYFFNSTLGLHRLDSIRRQVAVAGITGSDLAKLEVSLPSLAEQRAIAHILGTLDDKIELNRRMNETLEAMARALFKSWFVDFDPVRAKSEGRDPGLAKEIANLFPSSLVGSALGEIPRGWNWATLGEISELNPEVWTKETRPPNLRYVDLSNTKWGRIEAIADYPANDAPSRAQRVLRHGDTIVGTVRPGNGSYALVSEQGLTGSTGFAVLRPNAIHFAEFVYLAATAQGNIESLAHLADGGAYPAIRPEAVAATQIALPDEGILKRFGLAVQPLLARIAHCECESRTLADLRNNLLPKLVSGELRLKDAERYVARAL